HLVGRELRVGAHGELALDDGGELTISRGLFGSGGLRGRSLGSGSLGSGSLGLGGGAGVRSSLAAGGQRKDHAKRKHECKYLFHLSISSFHIPVFRRFDNVVNNTPAQPLCQ